jgi:hypothetical protein
MEEYNKKIGKIVYSKNYHKNKISHPFHSYNKKMNKLNNFFEATKKYDNIINQAKKTIEECKKQFNEEDYFNSQILFNSHINNQS